MVKTMSLPTLLLVISARTTFESLFPNSYLKWKYYTFHGFLVGGGFFGTDGRPTIDKDVMSFGDSHIEREAIRALTQGVPTCRTKTVKFHERPTCEQLIRQIELVVQCNEYIFDHKEGLDLQLTVTLTPPTLPTPPIRPNLSNPLYTIKI